MALWVLRGETHTNKCVGSQISINNTQGRQTDRLDFYFCELSVTHYVVFACTSDCMTVQSDKVRTLAVALFFNLYVWARFWGAGNLPEGFCSRQAFSFSAGTN